MRLSRPPRPELRPFVSTVWAIEPGPEDPPFVPGREHVLPTGGMHLVFRLGEAPLRLFEGADDAVGRTAATALVGGARASFYVRELAAPSASVGAMLRPGAAELLFGVPAGELAGRHTALDELWGGAAAIAREQLLEARGAAARLERLERLLLRRLPAVRALHPAIAAALERLAASGRVDEAIAASGFSHRHFVATFRRAVGLAPKLWSRVVRFGRALDRAARAPETPWVEIALDAGYSDQSHFQRDFAEVAGMTPGEWRRAAPAAPAHVPADRPGGRRRR
jgi:AraC-like DNA-binding protein